MRGLSLFSGIGGFDLAMERAGIEIAGMCEINKQAQGILKRHFSNVTIYDDVRKVGKETNEPGSIDIICGGFPCQDLSVAGKRKGLAGERSGLWFEFARIVDELEPRWVVIENVPGLLSSAGGDDLAVILQWLVERGYGVTWRVLDSQYFGVPQRRRRIFIVASFGNGSSAEVLFERDGLFRYPKKSRSERKGFAAFTEKGFGSYGDGVGTLRATGGNYGGGSETLLSGTFTIRNGKPKGGGKGYLGSEEQSMTLGGQEIYAYNIQLVDDGRKDRSDGGIYVDETDQSMTLMTSEGKSKTVVVWQPGYLKRGEGPRPSLEVTPTLTATSRDQFPHITTSVGVRKLTPTECERLQGFPDGWTDGQADASRYKQLGNAVTVSVVEWIIKRIVQVNDGK